MNGEYGLEQACGYYDEFQALLAEGYIGLNEVKLWYEKGFITEKQYKFGISYLNGD